MRVLALVVLFFVACSLAALTPGNGVYKTNDASFDVETDTPAGFNLTLNIPQGTTWTVTPTSASSGITFDPATGKATVDPTRLPLGLVTLVLKKANTTLDGYVTEQATYLIWDATAYESFDDTLTWSATLIDNNPARNLQWSPKGVADAANDFNNAPYSFIDEAHPSAPQDAPSTSPLYWGNYYEIRLGILNEVTGTYCGTNGTWPENTNSDDIAPTPSHPHWNATNSQGCPTYLEAGDTWTFPAPYQRIPNAANTAANGYDTITGQTGVNAPSNTGPLVWSSRGGSSTLSFTGLALPSDWLSKCAPADTVNTSPQQYPCYSARYNPDPQVWVVSATGAQPARFTAIGTGVTPKNQATPPVPLSLLALTNEFLVNFEWPNQVAVTGATGIPAQPAITSVPTCQGPASGFVGLNGSGFVSPNLVIGVNYYPSCNQGLKNNKALLSCDETQFSNCRNATDAAADGATFASNTLQTGGSPLNSVWLSQRPLQISNGTVAVLNPGNGRANALEVFYDAQQGTLPLTISFPLDADNNGLTGSLIRDNYWNNGANGTTNPGVVSITPKAVFECASNDGVCLPSGATPEYVAGSLGAFFGGNIPTLTVSAASPTTTLSFAGLPSPTTGKTWVMFFEVKDASGATYPYTSIPYLIIQLQDITTDWINFPPEDNTFYITQPQSSAPNSYNYQIRIKRSPKSLGLDTVVVNWQVTGATSPLEFWVDGAKVNAFTFSGYQTVINFQVFTQQTPVGPFSLTFSSSSAFLDVSTLDLTGLFVAANPISIKTQDSTAAQGPYAGEPVWFELTFSPPATSSFTVTASGTGLFEGTKSVTVNVGDTGVLLGPVTPILPQNIPLTAATYNIPIAFASSSAAYSVPSVVSLTVRRHSLIVTNGRRVDGNAADDAELNLFTTGERSRPYCIAPSYNVFNSSLVGATDSLTVTFAAVEEENVLAGLIFEPATLTLTAAAPRQCVTIRADRSFPWDSEGGGEWTYDIQAYLGGSLAYMFQNPLGVSDLSGGNGVFDFPSTVVVSRLTVEVELDQSKLVDTDDVYALGETVQLRVWVDVLPPVGLNYTIIAPGVTLTPSTAGVTSTASHGRFGPAPASGASAQWQAWDVTFGGYAGDFDGDADSRVVEFTIYLSSGDAEFYRDTDPSPALGHVAVAHKAVSLVKRVVKVVYTDDEVAVKSLTDGETTVTVSLQHPVINGLTVNVVARQTNNASSGGLTFSTNALVFTAGGPNAQSFTITGELLGEYEWTLYLSGPDADWFDLDLDSDWLSTTVTKRDGFFFTDFLGSAGSLVTGFTYGPVGINFQDPLNIGESVTITPFGGDFKFTPASITLTAGQSSALFSFVYTGITEDAGEAVVFWSITGPSAWMYDYSAADLRQVYNFTVSNIDVVFSQTDDIIPGTTHEGYVTLPFPVATDLTITPLAIGSAVTFSPATWTFTPATGTTLHFTYTVSATQAFALSGTSVSNGPDVSKRASAGADTDAAGLRVVFLTTGTDADNFASLLAPVELTLVRPEFRLDNTYGVNNVKEQTFDKHFIVGKWSTLYSVYLTAPPAAGGVTLTITDSQGVLEFLVGQSTTPATSAVLTFTADSYVQNFKFRFVKLLSGDSFYNGVEQLSVSVSGANAAAYGFSQIFGGFQELVVVPALAFSPIPAIYTDGSASGLFVAVKGKDGSIGGAWPYADDAQFTIHISVGGGYQSAVSVEPSTLEFSKSQSNDAVQSFRIVHTYPRAFGSARSYPLKFALHFAGSENAPVDITALVPQDAQNVLLARYQVIPKFPHVLSYGWQSASLNLSHIPVAHVSFIPRLPPVDGDYDVRAGRAAGRVDFEPAIIVAAPGQQVVHFKVKAQPGIHRDSLYYRVDWEVHGHEDDLVNWVEYLQQGSQGLDNSDSIFFATWHLASAGATTISFAMIVAVCFVAVVRNMF